MSPTRRLAIITGANRGIGLETCRQLAQLGYRVVLTSRDEVKGRAAVSHLAKSGATVDYHPLDVTSQASVNQLHSFIEHEVGRVDAIINNAALYLDEGRNVLDVDVDLFRPTMETNVYGPLMLCQAFTPLMVEQRYGRIVNVSSGSGQLASMGGDTPAYGMSKIASFTL